MTDLSTARQLEAVVGSRPPTHHLKSITDLDGHCETILEASPFAVVGAVAGDGSLRIVTAGGAPGASQILAPTLLAFPSLPRPDVPHGAPAGALALVPGYGETLRVNGRLVNGPAIDIEEAFLHCAKAVIRSHLWDEPTTLFRSTATTGPTELDDPEAADFLARSPFVLLASADADGHADVSPKGDPPGFVQILDDHTLAVPDRPGNRRTDTLHNLLTSPDIALLALVPGDGRSLEVRGRARVSDDETVRRSMEVAGKVPRAAIVIDVDHVELRVEPAIEAARLWDTTRHVEPGALPRGATVWVDHIKRNDDPGLAARAARKVVNERMMRTGIDRDYRDNLY